MESREQTIKQAYGRQLAYAPIAWGRPLDAAARPAVHPLPVLRPDAVDLILRSVTR